MNSQIEMMVFEVEGGRGPPESKKEKFDIAIIKNKYAIIGLKGEK